MLRRHQYQQGVWLITAYSTSSPGTSHALVRFMDQNTSTFIKFSLPFRTHSTSQFQLTLFNRSNKRNLSINNELPPPQPFHSIISPFLPSLSFPLQQNQITPLHCSGHPLCACDTSRCGTNERQKNRRHVFVRDLQNKKTAYFGKN